MAQLRDNIRKLVNLGTLTGVSGNVWRASVGPFPETHRHVAAGIVYGLVILTKKSDNPGNFVFSSKDMSAYYADHLEFESLRIDGSKTLKEVGAVYKTLRNRGVLKFVDNRQKGIGNFYDMEWCNEPMDHLLSSYTDDKDVGWEAEIGDFAPTFSMKYIFKMQGKEISESAFKTIWETLQTEGKDPFDMGLRGSWKVIKKDTHGHEWDSSKQSVENNRVVSELVEHIVALEEKLHGNNT